jgi:cell division septation protein DedD
MTSEARAALEAGDDGFHEIQLNGKQLVFLGMATTLVSVVIFLCGVLVGRGVKPLDTIAQTSGSQPFDVPVAASVSPGTVTAPAATVATSPAPAPAPTAAAAGAGEADDTHPTPLDEDIAEAAPVAEVAPAPVPAPAPAPVKPAAPPVETRAEAKPFVKPADAAKPTPTPTQAAVVPPAAAKPATETAAAATPPATGGRIAVQVGAFKTRGEADVLAKRLSSRGYPVYVMNPNDGKAVYRVRVGNFASADEAQRTSARLTQQEKLKPWVTR